MRCSATWLGWASNEHSKCAADQNPIRNIKEEVSPCRRNVPHKNSHAISNKMTVAWNVFEGR
jgi:hypothetical protein